MFSNHAVLTLRDVDKDKYAKIYQLQQGKDGQNK